MNDAAKYLAFPPGEEYGISWTPGDAEAWAVQWSPDLDHAGTMLRAGKITDARLHVDVWEVLLALPAILKDWLELDGGPYSVFCELADGAYSRNGGDRSLAVIHAGNCVEQFGASEMDIDRWRRRYKADHR